MPRKWHTYRDRYGRRPELPEPPEPPEPPEEPVTYRYNPPPLPPRGEDTRYSMQGITPLIPRPEPRPPVTGAWDPTLQDMPEPGPRPGEYVPPEEPIDILGAIRNLPPAREEPVTYNPYQPPSERDLYGVGRYPGMGSFDVSSPFEGPLGEMNQEQMRRIYSERRMYTGPDGRLYPYYTNPEFSTPAEDLLPYHDLGFSLEDLGEALAFPAEDWVEVSTGGGAVTGGRGVTDPTLRLEEQMAWLNAANELRNQETGGVGGGYGGWGGYGGGGGGYSTPEPQSRQPYRPNMSDFVQQLVMWRGV